MIIVTTGGQLSDATNIRAVSVVTICISRTCCFKVFTLRFRKLLIPTYRGRLLRDKIRANRWLRTIMMTFEWNISIYRYLPGPTNAAMCDVRFRNLNNCLKEQNKQEITHGKFINCRNLYDMITYSNRRARSTSLIT